MLERQAMCSACLFLQSKKIMLNKHLKNIYKKLMHKYLPKQKTTVINPSNRAEPWRVSDETFELCK
jgi:hypothetical protein